MFEQQSDVARALSNISNVLVSVWTLPYVNTLYLSYICCSFSRTLSCLAIPFDHDHLIASSECCESSVVVNSMGVRNTDTVVSHVFEDIWVKCESLVFANNLVLSRQWCYSRSKQLLET